MIQKNKSIGIFDSGLGGLTVLKALETLLPKEKFIYFGDTAHVPYGNKSPNMIKKYCLTIVNFLIQQDIKLIIVACNTASSTVLNEIKKFTTIPIIDVIHPSVIQACKTTKTQHIGIIGTETTIQSHEYNKQIKAKNKKIKIYSQACPLLVPIIEEGLFNHIITTQVTKMYFQVFKNKKIDTLILGCTHYPIMTNIIKKNLSTSIQIVDSAKITAKYVKKYLKQTNNISNNHIKPQNQYFVSDKVSRFQQIANMFLEEKQISITQKTLL